MRSKHGTSTMLCALQHELPCGPRITCNLNTRSWCCSRVELLINYCRYVGDIARTPYFDCAEEPTAALSNCHGEQVQRRVRRMLTDGFVHDRAISLYEIL